jgi:hypothetical protein
MKGKLRYISKDKTLVKSWVVWYNDTPVGGNVSFVDSLPLHPDDVKQIEEDSKVFDNIEARITAYPDVEFDIVLCSYSKDKHDFYAKLINQDQETICEYSGLPSVTSYTEDEYPELEGTNTLSEDIIKKRKETLSKIVKLSEEEWVEVMGVNDDNAFVNLTDLTNKTK